MTKTLFSWIVALFACVLMSGCETMSPKECQAANWSDVGMRDGVNGERLTMLDERVKDCAKAGTPVDTRAYLGGRERGLQSYCRLDNAATLGLNGSAYHGVCPGAIDAEFRRRHQTGYAVQALRTQVNDMDSRTRRLERRLRDADQDEDKQLKKAEKDEDRKRIRKEFDDKRRQWRRELSDLDRDIRHARHDLRSAEIALDNLR